MKDTQEEKSIKEVKKKINKMVQTFGKYNYILRVGIGKSATTIDQLKVSYFDAEKAFLICKYKRNRNYEYIKEISFFNLIFSIPIDVYKDVYRDFLIPILEKKIP